MIFSASRRTDIPSFYADWLFRRLEEGCVAVRHDARRVTRYVFSRPDVDCLALWTKNPLPLLPRLDDLRQWPCVFQFTLTAYGKEMEPGLPDRAARLDAFRELAAAFGPERMVWRYDPLLLGGPYTVAWHVSRFEDLARRLRGCARTCVISFLDWYPKIRGRIEALGVRETPPAERRTLGAGLAAAARANGFRLCACAEGGELEAFGIRAAGCLSRELVEGAAGRSLELGSSRQRPLCRCVASGDIGAYGTCGNACAYCYANGEDTLAPGRASPLHEADSPLLVGRPSPKDMVTERRCASLASRQLSLF